MFEIKKIDNSEWFNLQKISTKTFSDTFGNDNNPKDLNDYLIKAYNKEQLVEELSNTNSEFYFIYLQSEIAGYLKLNIGSAQTENVSENSLEIERIYIDSKFKRNGLGKRLYDLANQRAREQAKDSIWLGVWENNLAAIKFYESLRFQKIGQHSFFLGNDEQIDYIMEKKLNS